MKEDPIVVPKGIRYLSEWKEFKFEKFKSRCILDKQIPGCGYTEWAITNDKDVIIASPRKILLQNKADQHEGEVFLVINDSDQDLGIDIDLYSKGKPKEEITNLQDDSEELNFRNILFNKLKSYIEVNNSIGKKSKILVTYDSYYIVKSILIEQGIFDQFWTVVDEMQSLLEDSRFKSTTELKFMDSLRDVEKCHFVSATPILGDYLEMLDDFKDVPYYELDWSTEDPTRTKKPDLKVFTMKSVGEKLPEIIKKYQEGRYDSKYLTSAENLGTKVVSDEAVFYVNSVRHIVSAIKKCAISPSEVNILCANTPLNQKKIKSLGPGYSIGSVPLKGIKPKKFTFCTRTVYLGADFYSTCAQSYIFSDSNIDCLAVDISQDLPQILGRQRLIENPWRSCATFYYRSTSDYNKMSKEDFELELKKKREVTESLLRSWQNAANSDKPNLTNVYKFNAAAKHYKEDYVAVTNGKAVFNNYAHVADVRAFSIQQKDYADRFSVFSSYANLYGDYKDHIVATELENYINLNRTYDRLQRLCEFYWKFGEEKTLVFLGQIRDDDPVKDLFLAAGPERCKANGYNSTKIEEELGTISFNMEELDRLVYGEFQEGGRYEKSYLKQRLQELFDDTGYKKKAKATSIDWWFEIKPILLTVNGKKVNGFELIKRK